MVGTARVAEAGEAAGLRHRMGHWRYKLNHLVNASVVQQGLCAHLPHMQNQTGRPYSPNSRL